MQKQVLLYGLGLAILLLLLKYTEYSFLLHRFSHESYFGFIALFFTALGIWGGLKWMQKKPIKHTTGDHKEVQKQFALSNREMEVLEGIAEGLSNQQIALKLFVSESTIKTHTSNLFAKLDVKRRTQAVQKAREVGLLN